MPRISQEQVSTWINDGGITLDVFGDAVAFGSGFQVARKAGEAVLDARDIQAVHSALQERLDEIDLENWFAYVGLWIDEGKAYIDVSYLMDDKDEAMEYGRKESQISIWDWNNNDIIYL